MPITVTLRTEDATTYVPDYDDNREQAGRGEDHFEVDLLPLSGRDYEKLHSQVMGGKKMTHGAILKRSHELVKRIMGERVPRVRGFALVDAAGLTISEPTTGEALYDVVMRADVAAAEIIDDIIDAIKETSALESGDLGKLRARYGSSSPTMLEMSATGSASAAPVTSTKKATPNLTNGSIEERSDARPATATAKQTPASALGGIQN